MRLKPKIKAGLFGLFLIAPILRPATVEAASPVFRLQASSGSSMLIIEDDGDLILWGTLTQSVGTITPTGSSNNWVLEDGGSTVVASVEIEDSGSANVGDMDITGTLTTSYDFTSYSGSTIFEARDSSNALVAVIETDGDLLIKGSQLSAPSDPTNLVATSVLTKNTLTWDHGGDADGFKIERWAIFPGFSQYATTGPDVLTYDDEDIYHNLVYHYRVRAYKGVTNSGYSNEDTATANNPTPTAPSGLAATAASSSQINLAWTDASNTEDGFKIERKTGPGGTWLVIKDDVAAEAVSYSDTGLSHSSQYFYRVSAFNWTGTSAASNEDDATTTTPASPVCATGTAGGT